MKWEFKNWNSYSLGVKLRTLADLNQDIFVCINWWSIRGKMGIRTIVIDEFPSARRKLKRWRKKCVQEFDSNITMRVICFNRRIGSTTKMCAPYRSGHNKIASEIDLVLVGIIWFTAVPFWLLSELSDKMVCMLDGISRSDTNNSIWERMNRTMGEKQKTGISVNESFNNTQMIIFNSDSFDGNWLRSMEERQFSIAQQAHQLNFN